MTGRMQLMDTIYKNDEYTVAQLLDKAEVGLIAIPNIQRPYVWEPSQLARFVDSLMHGWPCGSILLWQTNSEEQNIFGTRRFERQFSTIEAECRSIHEEQSDYKYLILDGQQRIQSLILAFSANSGGYCASTFEWKRDMGSTGGKRTEFERKFLCYNLSGWKPEIKQAMPSFLYLDYEESALPETPCLMWLTENEIEDSSGKYVSLCRLPEKSLCYPDALAWLRGIVQQLRQNTRIAVLKVDKLNYRVKGLDDDESIVQIFTRLNTAGTPLTKEQIQAAKVKSLWVDFPERINDLKDTLSKEPYQIMLEDDDLVNGFNIVLRAWCKTWNISDAYTKVAQSNAWDELWKRFARYTKEVISELNDKKLFFKTEYKSLYVLWFPVAHMCCRDSSISDVSLLVRWLLVTSWAKIWANRSGQYVKSFTDKLIQRNDSDTTENWLQCFLLGEKRDETLVKLAKDTINNLAASHRGSVRDYYMPLWAWTRMKDERIKFVLSFGYNAYAVDHIMPVARIKDVNLRAKYNSLGNCWLLCTASNSAKSDDSFVTFLKNFGVTDKIEDIAVLLLTAPSHLRAELPEQMDLNDIERREKEIKEEIMDYIDTDKVLFFPDEEKITQRKYKVDTSGVFRGDEYLKTISNRRLGTQGNYISHVRTAMRNLGLSEQMFREGLADEREKLEELVVSVNEQGNAATGWRQYLGFLLGKKGTRNKSPRAGQPRTRTARAPRQRQALYMENEFVQSLEEGKVKQKTIQDYISHTNSAIKAYGLCMEEMANLDTNKLNKYLENAAERGNCATGWRFYLRFLTELVKSQV